MINEKTKIPLGWALSILGSISGVIATGAIAHYRLNVLERDWMTFQSSFDSKSEVDQAQELKIQKLEIMLGSIGASLERIENKLERLEAANEQKR